jgi:hypothetical protein
VDVEVDFPRDRKDAKFLACAIAAGADFFITGDADFNEAQTLLNTTIISLSLLDPSENSQANIYKALRPVLADSVSTKKSVFDIVTDSLEQKNT